MKRERQELNDRFIQALDWLESEGKVTRYSHRKEDTASKSYTDLAVIMGDGVSNLPTSRIADFRNRKRFVDYPEAIRFAKAFDIRKEWMVFGEGPMTPGMMIVDIETDGVIGLHWADLPSVPPYGNGKTVIINAKNCEDTLHDNDFQKILHSRFEAMQRDKSVYGFTK